MTIRRLLAKARFRRVAAYLAMGTLLAAVAILAGGEIGHHINTIETWIANLGPWGILAFVGLFVAATSLMVPDTLLSIMAGMLFGLGGGITVVLTGSLLAAAVQYALARRLLRARIERFLAEKPTLGAIQRAVSRSEIRLQALLRLTPLNPAMANYMLGAAGVRFRGFLFACLALTPNLAIEVYLGYAGKHVARMAGSGSGAAHLHDLTLIGGLVVTIVVMVFISKAARKALMSAVSEGEAALPPRQRTTDRKIITE